MAKKDVTFAQKIFCFKNMLNRVIQHVNLGLIFLLEDQDTKLSLFI